MGKWISILMAIAVFSTLKNSGDRAYSYLSNCRLKFWQIYSPHLIARLEQTRASVYSIHPFQPSFQVT
ncbi:hypothetical protein H6F77_19615 [Microcoleus sp. FACHB-831]|uniref:hypothetical protein n=1 Tax=Microcoleus sp. FACHB-831 TaxID=2692827 RepID=UPI0016880D9E|nr:hypothetical protein [Microcoleus sp. FACHB-831]MBD1923262.1 hypothetical protein [Microcoleus sp. FACHB-831]